LFLKPIILDASTEIVESFALDDRVEDDFALAVTMDGDPDGVAEDECALKDADGGLPGAGESVCFLDAQVIESVAIVDGADLTMVKDETDVVAARLPHFRLKVVRGPTE
jgi:hypothetical protein